MLRIRMFCVDGISTSLLVRKMGEAAKRQGVDINLATCTMQELEGRIGEAVLDLAMQTARADAADE